MYGVYMQILDELDEFLGELVELGKHTLTKELPIGNVQYRQPCLASSNPFTNGWLFLIDIS